MLWVFYRHRTVLTVKNVGDLPVIQKWLQRNVGDYHIDWSSDNILEQTFYFRTSRDLVMFLMRWS